VVQIPSKHVAYIIKCIKVVSGGNLKFKFLLLESYIGQFCIIRDVTPKNTQIFKVTAVRTSNLTY